MIYDAFLEVFPQADVAGKRLGLPSLTDAFLSSCPPTGRELAERRDGSHQLALFAAQVTLHTALCRAGWRPDHVVGVSFGELAAAVACGVVDVADGAHAAVELGRVLLRNPGALTVAPVDDSRALDVIRGAGLQVHVAGRMHSEETLLVASSVSELERAEELIPGCRRMRLPFGGHHSGLKHELPVLREAWSELLFDRLRVPLYSATYGRAYADDDDLAECISAFLIRRLDFPAALRAAACGLSSSTWIECGTGTTATVAARRTLPASCSVLSCLVDLPSWSGR